MFHTFGIFNNMRAMIFYNFKFVFCAYFILCRSCVSYFNHYDCFVADDCFAIQHFIFAHILNIGAIMLHIFEVSNVMRAMHFERFKLISRTRNSLRALHFTRFKIILRTLNESNQICANVRDVL